MSETVTPVAPVAAAPAAAAPAPQSSPPTPSPEATGGGPAIGATPPEAGGESPAPAASSAPEATATEASILSAATGEAKAEEPAAEAPTEATPEAAAEETKPAEPPPAPTYEPFKLPDGVTLDAEKVTGFTGLLGEFESKVAADPSQAHALAQEFGQKLVDLHVAETRAAADRYTQTQLQNWERTREQWQADFRNDPELGKNRQDTTLTRMGALMDMYGKQSSPERLAALRDVLTNTGAGDHLEMLRFVNWAARKLTETARVVVPMVPRAPAQTGTKADRLYPTLRNGAA